MLGSWPWGHKTYWLRISCIGLERGVRSYPHQALLWHIFLCCALYVCVCVCVTSTGLVLPAACWSYVNRAVSHLLWPGWESSGGPGSLWVPGLRVIHSWLGDSEGGSSSLPESKQWRKRKRRGWMEQRKAVRKRKCGGGAGARAGGREGGADGWWSEEMLRVDWQFVRRQVLQRSLGTSS